MSPRFETSTFTCARCKQSRESYGAARRNQCCGPCYVKTYLEATRAHQRVSRARKAGLLADPKTLPCADCGMQARYYDHRDYLKPLDVQAVCASCNQYRGSVVLAEFA